MAIDGSNPTGAAQPTAQRTCAFAGVVLAVVLSWAAEPPTAKPDSRVGSGLDDGVNPYSKLSNEQLGTLAGTFEDLDRDQRRWFLTEVRKRMSAKGERPRIQVDQDDRFGRVDSQVGDTDQKAPPQTHNAVGALAADEAGADAPTVYGTGVVSQGEETADVSAPAPKSEDPANPSE